MSTRTTVPKGFDNIHRILGGAMRVAPHDAWPARPHLGGPLPVLSTARQVDIGRVVGEYARTLATVGEQRAVVDRTLELVGSVYGLSTKGWTKTVLAARTAIDKASSSAKSDVAVVRAAKLVVRAAFNDRWSAPSARNATGTCVERAAEMIVGHLVEVGGDVRAFLAEVDAAIVRAELVQLLADKNLSPSTDIARVLSRPKAKTGKVFALAFAELANGYGLLVKLKNRWQWHEGDRATMFATVPDEYMEQVIEDIEPKARLRATLRKSRAS